MAVGCVGSPVEKDQQPTKQVGKRGAWIGHQARIGVFGEQMSKHVTPLHSSGTP
jgi:hypothetical protein